MATITAPEALDERPHRRDDVIQWWLDPQAQKPGIEPPYLHMEERFIHRYFSETHFFDHTSNNGILFGQSRSHMPTYQKVHAMGGVEESLRKLKGKQYVITEKPQQVKVSGQAALEPSNVWVLREQERLDVDETETRGTFFIVNENVYKAPSVADVVGNRMLGAIGNLEKMFDRMATLPSFTPATGHTYLPPRTKSAVTGTNSAAGSPSRSREGSLAPGISLTDSQSLRSGSTLPEPSTSNANADNTSILTTRLYIDSLQKSLQYRTEYMDENPLIGEPGHFRFSTSTNAVKKRKADDEAAALAAQKVKEQRESTSRAASPKPTKVPTPPPVFTAAKVEKEGKEKKRRRKSRVPGGTKPSTPTSAVTPAPAG
ncbi:hypothetical protein LTR62_007240 [Meristemomyces frigidus]|uniref:Mediator of RNA polymerase II transcription subunit 6 n=1 Tax=Meristemomyces frigidus TaxID=1508187 RepID=A0AAN7TJ49_9PEZI|nr:hypothetical protein LTR62_007240 [Meristemomyces frigidus]